MENKKSYRVSCIIIIVVIVVITHVLQILVQYGSLRFPHSRK